MKKYIIFASMGFELVGLIIGSFYLGQYLDTRINSKGLVFVGLSLACLIGWLIRVVWMINRIQDKEDNDSTDQKL